jgi:regulatory protein
MEDFEKYYNLALWFLSFRVRSEKEVKDYLVKKIKNQKSKIKDQTTEPRIKEEIIDAIVEKLKKYKFINDEEFARIWIEQRLRFKPRSIFFLKRELLSKGVDKDIIDAQISNFQFPISNELENAQESENNDKDLDLESAKILAQKKMKRYENLPKQEQREKLGRFLASKGFNWDTIKKTINDLKY